MTNDNSRPVFVDWNTDGVAIGKYSVSTGPIAYNDNSQYSAVRRDPPSGIEVVGEGSTVQAMNLTVTDLEHRIEFTPPDDDGRRVSGKLTGIYLSLYSVDLHVTSELDGTLRAYPVDNRTTVEFLD